MRVRLLEGDFWAHQYTDARTASTFIDSLEVGAAATWTRIPDIFAVTSRNGQSFHVSLGDWVLIDEARRVIVVLGQRQFHAVTAPV
jgi:hypothetical protein